MSPGATRKETLLRRVGLLWYPVALVPLLALLGAGLSGWLPAIVGLLALFLTFFWVFSFGFAVYSKLRKPKEPRQ